jgi:superfamily II DNA or RNA helicase
MQAAPISFLHQEGKQDFLALLNSTHVSALQRALQRFDGKTMQRGQRYFANRNVREVSVTDGLIQGVVEGTETYDTTWAYEDGSWESSCTCPVEHFCKHAFAVALAALATMDGEPVQVRGAKKQKPKGTSFKDEIAGKIGRRLSIQDKAIADRIERLHREIVRERRTYLYSTDLDRLGLRIRISKNSWEHIKVMEGWWISPPDSPLAFWQFLAFFLEESQKEIPGFLRPLTDTSIVVQRVRELGRKKEVEKWEKIFQWVAEPEEPAPRRPIRVRLIMPKIHWEEEFAPGDWRRVVAHEVRAMAEARVPHPDTASMLLLIYARREGGYGYRSNYALQMDREEDARFLNAVLGNELTRARVVLADGTPLEFTGERLRWEFRPSERDPSHEMEARLVAPGIQAPDRFGILPGILPGATPLALVQGRVYFAPPPLPRAGNGYAPAFIPTEALRSSPTAVAKLKKAGAILPSTLEAEFETVSLVPCFVFEVSQNFYSEQLQVRLLARFPAYGIEKIWNGRGGWTFTEADSGMRYDGAGRALVFDTSASDVLKPTLELLQLSVDHSGVWYRAIDKRFSDEFSIWAQALPSGIEILASPELRAFFEPPRKVGLEFEIEEREDSPDWFDMQARLEGADVDLTPEEVAALLKAQGGFVRLKSGMWARIEARLGAAELETLETLGLTLDTALSAESHRYHALQLASVEMGSMARNDRLEPIRRRAEKIRSIAPPAPPRALAGTLRQYQKEGFHFLAFLAANGFGGILADDMGLGKTIQSLAWLLWLKAKVKTKKSPFRVLVVCPKSVTHNWVAEATRFAPSLTVAIFASGMSVPERAGLVVANYTQLRLHAAWFCEHSWDAVILDEGQNIKNPGSKTAKTARELKAAQRLILTGTPIENRALDLWSLFAFAQPGLLGSQASFKRLYETRSNEGQALAMLQSRVRHFLLRRTKAQVAPELPPRTEEELLCDLDGEQSLLYRAELKKTQGLLLGVETKRAFDQARFNILQSLLRLRQICCDPRLLAGKNEPGKYETSAKMEALFGQLRPLVAEGHKVLVFSQFVEMLRLISVELDRETIPHLMLTGQTQNRQELVETFQSDQKISVFLLSLKAAGSGLNLTAASYVILYDPWWNPAVEAQAIDRTHRIGQSKPVIAYRLIARNTIEEKIRALQTRKSAVASAIVQEESLAKVLDLESLQFLLAE